MTTIRRISVVVLLCVASVFGAAHFTASAAKAPSPGSIRVYHQTVDGHEVYVCRWNGYTAVASGQVLWSQTHIETLYKRIHTVRNAVCGINGNTYVYKHFRPTGPVRTHGHWVYTGHHGEPMYGFVGRKIVWGWQAVVRDNAQNVMSGKAWIVRNGHAIKTQKQAPFTTHAQFWCGARGTDSWYGCYRSAAVEFKDGTYGLVSIALASDPEAGKILTHMGVTYAVNGDDGGGTEAWFEGHRFGTIPNHGPRSNWKRRLPDAIVVSATGCF